MPATKEYWPLVLENLKTKISGSVYKAWFSRLEFISTGNHGRKLVIGVPSAFNKNYIENKFRSELKDAVSKYYPQVIHIDYQIVKSEEDETVMAPSLMSEEDTPSRKGDLPQTKDSESLQKLSTYLPRKNLNNLNPKYTFENFIVTNNNELAVSVCNSVVSQPGTLYNPVFIYGGVGLGKTHLIQAVGQKMLEQNPSFNIKYIPSETFVNQFILAFQKRKMDEFREYYRTVDLLLIDDVQFIAGKEATQEVFFHTFNELHQANKQIILTSDRPPKSLGGIEERLVSRFEMGMVVDIPHPDLEARIAILKDKAERLNLNLEPNQLQLIAAKVDSNVRELEGILNKIQAKARLRPDFGLDDAAILSLLQNQGKSDSPLTIKLNLATQSPDRVLQAVCKVFSLTKADILGSSREKNIALARQFCMWFYKYELDMSYPTIGKMFGGRDHTTVMHGCNKVSKLLDSDQKSKQKLELIRELLQQM